MNARVKDELAFRFVSGHRALDFLATLGNRHRNPVERLNDAGDLDRWLAAAGLLVAVRATPRDLHAARQMRETVNRVTRAVLAGGAPSRKDVQELNSWARRPALAPQIAAGLERGSAAERPVGAALAVVAREAVELLTSPDRALIRECAATPECSLLFLDRSRAGRRRWCEMETCGSRAKMTSYRRRQAAA